MATSKPAILLVHGGWHTPAHFAALSKHLHDAGFEVVAPRLPSCNLTADPGNAIDKDASVVAEAISRITSAGKDVVIVMHSYGGTAGCEGLGVYSSEAQANPTTRGRVVKLVFLSALLLDKGQSAASHQIVEPGEESGPTPQISPEGIILPADRDDQVARDITKSRLYNETPAEVAEAALNDLTGFSLSAYIEPTKHRGWDEGVPATYVLCGKDQAWPLAQQAKCIEMLKQTGVEIEVVKRDGWDHSPYLGHAGEVAEIVEHACTMAPA